MPSFQKQTELMNICIDQPQPHTNGDFAFFKRQCVNSTGPVYIYIYIFTTTVNNYAHPSLRCKGDRRSLIPVLRLQ